MVHSVTKIVLTKNVRKNMSNSSKLSFKQLKRYFYDWTIKTRMSFELSPSAIDRPLLISPKNEFILEFRLSVKRYRNRDRPKVHVPVTQKPTLYLPLLFIDHSERTG